MSRSRPNQGNNPNPCKFWTEWNGAQTKGYLEFYDKAANGGQGANTPIPHPWTFLVIEADLSVIRGWDDASGSRIYSNEVRDTTRQPFVVKSFEGGTLAEGLYRDIRDKVIAKGGYYAASIYIAYKARSGAYQLGNIKLAGAALSAWLDFYKKNRQQVMDGAVQIDGFTEGQKGGITFCVPKFRVLPDVTDEQIKAAIALDEELQKYLDQYMERKQSVEKQAEETVKKEESVQSTAQEEVHEQQTTEQKEPPPPLGSYDLPF